MVNRYMKMCSTLDIREMQMQTTMRIAIIKKTITSILQDVEKTRMLLYCFGNIKQ